MAVVDLLEAVDAPQQRALTAAARSAYDDLFLRVDLQRNSAKNVSSAVSFMNLPERNDHASLFRERGLGRRESVIQNLGSAVELFVRRRPRGYEPED